MAATLKIGAREIGDHTPCYVIAEIGHNHQGSLDKARELFREAKLAGAHAVKLQKRDNRGLYTRAAYERPYDNENSFGATYGEHREFLEFGREEYTALQAYAKELGVDFFSTAFDIASADFLESLNVPAYKIASGDLKSLPLLKHVAAFGKPMIVSTGGALLDDVKRAYEAILPINPKLAILQCTAGYPAAFEELDLRVISTYRERFPKAVIGFSSHDEGHRPCLLTRAGRSSQDGARPRSHVQSHGRRQQEAPRERTCADPEDGQESCRGEEPAQWSRPRRQGHCHEVAGRRDSPVRARQGDRPNHAQAAA
jgi:sialic acid synthase